MGVFGEVIAMLLPLALLAILWVLAWRWRQRRGDAPINLDTRRRQATFLIVVVVVTVLGSGALGGWSLESLLMPIGWLLTGLVIALIAWRFRR